MSSQGDFDDSFEAVKGLGPLTERELVIFAKATWAPYINGYINEDRWGEEWRDFLTNFSPWLADDGKYDSFRKVFFG